MFGSGFGEVFFMSPNLASCERVFALLKNMFGEQQLSALNDYILGALRGTLSINNERTVG